MDDRGDVGWLKVVPSRSLKGLMVQGAGSSVNFFMNVNVFDDFWDFWEFFFPQ